MPARRGGTSNSPLGSVALQVWFDQGPRAISCAGVCVRVCLWFTPRCKLKLIQFDAF